MEFTGLLDKNGKEIYEGDVMKIYGSTFEIVWFKGAYHFKHSDNKSAFPNDYLLKDLGHKCEVIGNIYENPELLTGSRSEATEAAH